MGRDVEAMADSTNRRELEVVERFWAESRLKAARRKEIEAMPRKMDRFEAFLREAWTSDNMAAVLYGTPIRSGPQSLDEWLAEDNPCRLTHYGAPGVREALGIS